jgi:drug/metabolite transporter (DMT)-like permease
MNPVATMLFASIILKEKLTVKKVACILLAIFGVYTVMGGVNNEGKIVGALSSVFALISWSFVTVTVRKISKKYDSLQITTYGLATALVCAFPVSIYELVTTPNVQFDASAILSLIYLGLFPTALAFSLWNKSLSLIDASTCSSFYPVQPLISFLLGWMFLGETISLSFVFGAILIIGGVFLSVIDIKDVPVFAMARDKFHKNM